MAAREIGPVQPSATEEQLIDALTAIVNQLATGMNVLTAQMDTDAGITDTDYATNVGTIDTIAFLGGNTPT